MQRESRIPDRRARLCVAGIWCACLSMVGIGLFDVAVAHEEPSQKTETTVASTENRPQVPGILRLHGRRRVPVPNASETYEPVVEELEWKTAETAIIICDMWTNLWCRSATQRIGILAPKMNRVITAARNHGVMIIHAPSSGVHHYEGTEYRTRMQAAPTVRPPVPIQRWCYLEPDREVRLPIDDSDGGCDDPGNSTYYRDFDRHEHPAIQIVGYDGISASGEEIYNFCLQQGIKNIVMMGVHTNMCVLGRPFGIRQLIKLGFNVVLARDLTDAMYDPRDYPYVSHTRGTELVIEHIETHWCPSIPDEDLTRIIGSSADPLPEVVRNRPPEEAAPKK